MNPWSAMAMLLLGFAPVSLASDTEVTPAPVIFVGRLLAVRELPSACDPGERCFTLDTGYELQYQVLQTISGRPASQTMMVSSYAHNGLEPYAYYPEALLFVYQSDKGNVTARYLGFPVAETDQREWVYCGDPYNKNVAATLKRFRRVTFAKPVELSSVSKEFSENAAFADPFGAMQPGTTRCKRAIAAGDLAAYARTDAEPGHPRVFVMDDK